MSSENYNSFEALQVQDVMIPVDQYPSVNPECTLQEAIRILDETKLEVNGRTTSPRALLVLDKDGNFRGCLRRREIMGGLEPKFLMSEPVHYRMKLFDVNLDPNLSELCNTQVRKGIRDQANRPVSEVLRPIETSLNYDDHLMKAIYEMVVYGLSIIPVVREQKVIGIVRSIELLHELAKLVE